MSVQAQCLEKLYDYNMTRPSEAEKRTALLSKRDKSEQVFYERIFRYAALKYSLIRKDYLRFCLA